MDYLCYECFITPYRGSTEEALARSRLIVCPRDEHYHVETDVQLRCLHCGKGIVVDKQVRRWYGGAGAGRPV